MFRIKTVMTIVIMISFLCSIGFSSKATGESFELDLFVSGDSDTVNYRIPALITTPSGVVIAAADARRDRPGDPPNNIDLHIKRSLDNGKTWSNVIVAADFYGDRSAGDPLMFYDNQTDTLWLGYVYANEGVGLAKGINKAGYGDDTFHIYLQQSKDDGLTWSSPVDITRQIKPEHLVASWSSPGIGIQLRCGRLIFCFSTMNADKRQDSYVAYSDDNGKTWKSSRAGIGTNESQVVELNDGRLIIVLRKDPGMRLIAYSNDRGETWEPQFESDTLLDPKCQASILRYSSTLDGDDKDIILYCNPASDSRRRDLTVRASFDEGKTWPVSRLINEGYSGYSCMTKLPDGQIGILYERNVEEKHTLTFTRFSLEWLLESK